MNNSQVAHLWAHQTRVSAHGSNYSFEGSTLYSYSTAIAWLDLQHNVAFISSDSMTPTTAKQLSYARSALYGLNYRMIYTPAFHYGRYSVASPAEMIQAAADELTKAFKGLYRKKSRLDSAISFYTETRNNLLEVAQFYRVRLDLPEASGDLKEKAAEIEKREEKARKAAEAKKRRQERLLVKQAESDLQAWLNGDAVSFPSILNSYDLRYKRGDLLTIRGDTVYTSYGADVPLAHAKRALKQYKEKPRPWHRNGENIRVGHFQIDEILENGDVKAGCHVFKAAEVERFAGKVEG